MFSIKTPKEFFWTKVIRYFFFFCLLTKIDSHPGNDDFSCHSLEHSWFTEVVLLYPLRFLIIRFSSPITRYARKFILHWSP